MTISINGTTGISGVDGSATTPALQGGDTNTGISFGTDEVRINTGGTQRAVVDASGRLGVGTPTPNSPLDVTGISRSIQFGSATRKLYAWSDSGGTSLLTGDTQNGTGIYFNESGHTLRFVTGATYTERARIDSSGRLLVGTSTSQGSYNLQCFGTGVWGQGAYVNGSDASLKDNVQDLESALDVVKAMRPVTFQYKSEYSQDTSTQSGFIAQELQQAMQGKQYLDGIVKPGTNHLNVAYQGIIAVLVKAVQELEAEVQALKGGN